MKVLVAIDGSKYSDAAVDFILDRPWAGEDEFLVLCVAEPAPEGYAFKMNEEARKTFENSIYENCTKVTSNAGLKLKKKLETDNVEARVETGFVAETICRVAGQWNADLIVMGSHGRTGLSRFFLGSVAEKVLKEASCSVEIVKHVADGKMSA